VELSAEQIRCFHNSGFLSVPRPLFDHTELSRLRGEYDRLFHQRAGRAEGNQFDLVSIDDDSAPSCLPQIVSPDRDSPQLRGTYVDTVHAIATQLLGVGVTTQIFHAILKPAAVGAATPWHQDEAYWPPHLQYRSVSVWIPLQDVDVDNGCLWFSEGSHEWPVLEHRSIGGDPRVHGLEIVDTSVIRDPVACPLAAGALTIHLNRTAHYAGPNRTASPRRAIVLSAALAPRPYPAARRFPWNECKRTLRTMRASEFSGEAGTRAG
jgi:hypothetical protein